MVGLDYFLDGLSLIGTDPGAGLSVHDGRNMENAVKICMKFIFDCIYCFGSILHVHLNARYPTGRNQIPQESNL